MEKSELHRRIKRLYILLLVLIILVIVNQFFAGGLFELDGNALQTTAALDHEATANGSYEIVLRATDDGAPALSYDETFTITVNDLN